MRDDKIANETQRFVNVNDVKSFMSQCQRFLEQQYVFNKKINLISRDLLLNFYRL